MVQQSLNAIDDRFNPTPMTSRTPAAVADAPAMPGREFRVPGPGKTCANMKKARKW